MSLNLFLLGKQVESNLNELKHLNFYLKSCSSPQSDTLVSSSQAQASYNLNSAQLDSTPKLIQARLQTEI